jgi:hypothetical protein
MKYVFTFYFFCIFNLAFSQYTTPNTNKNWNLDSLVNNSSGNVTESGGIYTVSGIITVSATDTISITTNAIVKFAVNTHFLVNGTLKINPTESVTFTAVDPAAGFNGIRLDFSTATVLKKLILEYAVSLNIRDCSPVIDSCTFQFNNNNTSTSFGNGAISVTRANPLITNCKFINNKRAAIQGALNVSNAPKIYNCYFFANSTTNTNVPQINIGATGSDTAKIVNNIIIGGYTASGGIAFAAGGPVNAFINGNIIRKNRYGITLNGGSLINAVISYNVIDTNNIQNDPNLGGSGISFSGGSSTSHQNTIVTGNVIRANLWGITITPTTTGGGAMPNLGNLMNSDTTDDGKNSFINNTNTSTPGIDLYNNNVDDIFAQGNYWNTNNPSEIEDKIFHKPDDAALGLVNYSDYLLPVELVNLTAKFINKKILLNWQTATEVNSAFFELERSEDGRMFTKLTKITATGRGSNYSYIDDLNNATHLLYRLKIVDKDGRFKYSSVIKIKIKNEQSVKLYPTFINNNQDLVTEVNSDRDQKLKIEFIGATGRLLFTETRNIVAGSNQLFFKTEQLAKGVIYVRLVAGGIEKTTKIIKQ